MQQRISTIFHTNKLSQTVFLFINENKNELLVYIFIEYVTFDTGKLLNIFNLSAMLSADVAISY